jgi:DNA primase
MDYLKNHNWAGRPVGSKSEFVGYCPLHEETRPSFYVNAHKNLFFCHGCGRGGDLLRFVQLYLHLNFSDSVAHLKNDSSSGRNDVEGKGPDVLHATLELL